MKSGILTSLAVDLFAATTLASPHQRREVSNRAEKHCVTPSDDVNSLLSALPSAATVGSVPSNSLFGSLASGRPTYRKTPDTSIVGPESSGSYLGASSSDVGGSPRQSGGSPAKDDHAAPMTSAAGIDSLLGPVPTGSSNSLLGPVPSGSLLGSISSAKPAHERTLTSLLGPISSVSSNPLLGSLPSGKLSYKKTIASLTGMDSLLGPVPSESLLGSVASAKPTHKKAVASATAIDSLLGPVASAKSSHKKAKIASATIDPLLGPIPTGEA